MFYSFGIQSLTLIFLLVLHTYNDEMIMSKINKESEKQERTKIVLIRACFYLPLYFITDFNHYYSVPCVGTNWLMYLFPPLHSLAVLACVKERYKRTDLDKKIQIDLKSILLERNLIFHQMYILEEEKIKKSCHIEF